jgi:hypothetical protein
VFPVAELPELPRGKGNKIFGIPSRKAASGEESLVAVAVVTPGQTLRLLRRAPDALGYWTSSRLSRRARLNAARSCRAAGARSRRSR